MQCNKVKETIQEHIDSHKPMDDIRIKEHIEKCEDCRRYWTIANKITEITPVPTEEPSANLAERIINRIQEENLKKVAFAVHLKRFFWKWLPLSAAAGIIIVFGFLFVLKPPPATTSNEERAEIEQPEDTSEQKEETKKEAKQQIQNYITKRNTFKEKWKEKWKPELVAELIEDAQKNDFSINDLLSLEHVDTDFGGWGPLFPYNIQREIAVYMLKSPDAKVRRDAVCFFWNSDDKDAVPHIRKLLSDPDTKVQEEAISVLGQMGDSESFSQIETFLFSSNYLLRKASIQTLEEICDSSNRGKVLSYAKKLLADPDVNVVESAICVMRDLGAKDSASEIMKFLLHPNAKIRIAALRFFAHQQIKEKVILPELSILLSDSEAEVRRMALETLSQFNKQEIIPYLRKILYEPNVDMQIDAFTVIRQLQITELTSDIAGLLSNENSRIRGNAIKTLAKLQATGLEPYIIKSLSDKNSSVQLSAIYATWKLNLNSLLPELMKQLSPNNDIAVRASALIASLALLTNAPFPRLLTAETGEEVNELKFGLGYEFDPYTEMMLFSASENYLKSIDKLMTEISGYEKFKCYFISSFVNSPQLLDIKESLQKWQEWKQNNKSKFEDEDKK